MLNLVQHVVAKTSDPISYLDIIIIEKSEGVYSILMSASAFPIGTTFPSAEEGLIAARTALNKLIPPQQIKTMQSYSGEQFISNERLQQLI